MRSQRIGGKTYNVVSWMPAQKAPSGQPYRVIGYINEQNMVERVETWVEHPMLGDLHVETIVHQLPGLRRPEGSDEDRAEARRHGDVRGDDHERAPRIPPNLTQLLTPPPPAGGAPGAGRGAAPGAPAAAPAVASEKLADGVYRITGGYVALAVEFRDHVVVLEGGQSEARGLAVIAETKRVIPNKPIRYVVNTHAHFDHASGLAPFAAEGITIITHENNKGFLEKALGAPRTLVGDALAKANRKPKVESAGDKTRAQGRHAHHRAAPRQGPRAQRRHARRVPAEGEDPVHGGLQRPGPGQPSARRSRRWCRTSSG